MKNKGQALVEFIIILPIILLLVFGIIDFARIVHEKNHLESVSNEISTMYRYGKSIDEINNIISSESNDDITIISNVKEEYTTLTIKKVINPITPGITKILKSAFNISVKRVIYNE